MKKRIFINNISEWDNLKKETHDLNETIIFKFSPICAQSLDIQQDVEEWFEHEANDDNLMIAFVNVISARPLSQTIAAQTGIKHESPQLIWFNKNGEVKFSASHRRINQQTLNENIEIK